MRSIAIVINGYPRSGKDSAANLISAALSFDWVYHSVSSVDPVRRFLQDLGVNTKKKGPQERKLMADIQSLLNTYDWLPIRHTAKHVDRLFRVNPDRNCVCFVHIREPDAIRMFKGLVTAKGYTCKTMFVDRQVAREETLSLYQNHADTSVEQMEYDIVLDNNSSIEHFAINCKAIAKMIMEDKL